jgi:hypothetical protein
MYNKLRQHTPTLNPRTQQYARTHARMHARTHARTQKHKDTRKHTRMHVQTQSHGHTHAQTSRHTYAQVKTVEVKKLSGSTYNEGLSLVNLKSLGVLNADVLVIKVSLSLSFAGTRAHTQALSLCLSVSLLRSLSPPPQFPRVCV